MLVAAARARHNRANLLQVGIEDPKDGTRCRLAAGSLICRRVVAERRCGTCRDARGVVKRGIRFAKRTRRRMSERMSRTTGAGRESKRRRVGEPEVGGETGGALRVIEAVCAWVEVETAKAVVADCLVLVCVLERESERGGRKAEEGKDAGRGDGEVGWVKEVGWRREGERWWVMEERWMGWGGGAKQRSACLDVREPWRVLD